MQTRPEESFRLGRAAPPGPGERALYRALREKVPIIDASINKLRRLLGSFVVECPDEAAQRGLRRFLEDVPVGAAGQGIDSFLGVYFEELLTYGNAVGADGGFGRPGGRPVQRLPGERGAGAGRAPGGEGLRVGWGPAPALPLPGAAAGVRPEPRGRLGPGHVFAAGAALVSEILLKIYHTLGVNWDRLGNVRFAVTCKPDPSGLYAGERARQMAQEWQRAMRSSQVSDFVAVGDVSIKAIGADNQILDSEVPVRQMLEQIVAKLGVPPFLLGLSWSSTERMSSQQADMLTSELDAYRGLLTPVIQKICRTWLTLAGYDPQCRVEWEQITMQDEVDHANARYLTARARQLEQKEEEL